MLSWIKRKDKKPEWAAACTCVYTDKSGRRYYKYNDELDMPIMRKGEIDKCLLELRYGVDFTDVLNAMQTELSFFDKGGNAKPDMQKIGFYVQELLDRGSMLVVPETLFRISANTLIREDETPWLIDHEVLDEKISTFTAEVRQGGLVDFFQLADTMKYIGSSNITISELKMRIRSSRDRLNQVKQVIRMSTSDRLSATG